MIADEDIHRESGKGLLVGGVTLPPGAVAMRYEPRR